MIHHITDHFHTLNSFIEEKNPVLIVILTDTNTHEHCLPILLPNLESICPVEIIELEPGEENKRIENVSVLLEILAEFKAERNTLLINLGGGVITDLGGFVASIYKRGISFVNIPTTLLAMCDAAIGGKTGVNISGLKNIAGSFLSAEEIFIHTPFLQTLSKRELLSGFAEMLKHGLIADNRHYNNLIENKEISAQNISSLIKDSADIKQKIVLQDFKEKNIRKILNFGHTIGHAVESLFLKTAQPITHGEAVAIGMICESHLSSLKNMIDRNDAEKIIYNILQYYPIRILPFTNFEIIDLMQNDKKNSLNQIRFSLISGIGSCEYDVVATLEDIEKSIDYYRQISIVD